MALALKKTKKIKALKRKKKPPVSPRQKQNKRKPKKALPQLRPASKKQVKQSRKKAPVSKKPEPKVSQLLPKAPPEKKLTVAQARAEKKVAQEKEGKMDLGLTPMRIYLNQIDHIPLLTPEEEYDLAKKIKLKLTGFKQARDKMIQSNLRLVINIAKRYANMGLTFSDLVEEGNIGLMRAVDKFDYAKGYRFSTYASWWIKQGMMRALSNQSKMIRIPVHMYESITKWRKAREAYIQRFGRIPGRKELAEFMRVSMDKVKEIEGVLNNPASLNMPISLEGSSELLDVIEDKGGNSPSNTSHEYLTHQRIKDLLNLVSEREKRILILRFGLMGEEPRTLEDTAKEFSITRERVRQIEEAALKKIGHEAKNQDDKLGNYF